MSNDWEDDSFFDGDEETDLGEETPKTSSPVILVGAPARDHHASVRAREFTSQKNFQTLEQFKGSSKEGSKGKRTVRVRPMPPSMTQKWPDVVSCLLTLGSGKQVMFVKGG